ncbi:uncharacterized protein LOC130655456 [Hydractinia symbiolongicarpus]|uniref:uncharacterized protein LOC130655456 n=1 Tax=Hydractinia symbiolongicarpus TaxID=13093 RepID=UPI00254E2C2E|nr:uncharacterized protein LOC130655456 [Hydractinia symbiolongicarpus]
MMDVLFGFIRGLKIGNWELHLDATRQMLPWFFAYDRPNYSRYCTFYVMEMLRLPETHPGICEEFTNGNFAVRRSPGKFNKVPSDQCIEQTINREQKCHGGITGYSTSPGTIQRWVFTSHTIAKCISILEDMLTIKQKMSHPKELGKSRMEFDEASVQRCYDTLVSWGSPFNSRDSLVQICSGVEATTVVEKNLLEAHSVGKKEMEEFVEKRIKSNEISFYDRIKKNRLKTFKDVAVKKVCKVKEKNITIAAERSVFAKLLIIAQNRNNISMKEVLSYPLSPIPWALALPDGGLVKTVKSKLLAKIEEGIDPEESLPTNCCTIFDGMVLLQQLDGIPLLTFGDISEFLLKRILRCKSQIIYFVTDQYFQNSVKGYERSRRTADGTLRVRIERRDQKKPSQLKKYMRNDENKKEITQFLLNDWSNESRFVGLLDRREIYFNCLSKFFKIYVVNGRVCCEEESSLENHQEEADTKVFLCCNHASVTGVDNACIVTVDSDIVIYAVHFENKIGINIYLQIGSGGRKRILSVTKIRDAVGPAIAEALPAFHAFTGNDFTSAFHGIGKVKPYNLLKANEIFQNVFAKLGKSATFDVDLFPHIEQFVCKLYGVSATNTDDARYKKFCSCKPTPEPQQLPPTRDALLNHCKRVSYITAIVRNSLVANPNLPSPNGHGWNVNGEKLEIIWLLRRPAPDALLEMVSCSCRKSSSCAKETCVCSSYDLPCTDLCSCNCVDQGSDNDEIILENDVEDDSSDDESEDDTEDEETLFSD